MSFADLVPGDEPRFAIPKDAFQWEVSNVEEFKDDKKFSPQVRIAMAASFYNGLIGHEVNEKSNIELLRKTTNLLTILSTLEPLSIEEYKPRIPEYFSKNELAYKNYYFRLNNNYGIELGLKNEIGKNADDKNFLTQVKTRISLCKEENSGKTMKRINRSNKPTNSYLKVFRSNPGIGLVKLESIEWDFQSFTTIHNNIGRSFELAFLPHKNVDREHIKYEDITHVGLGPIEKVIPRNKMKVVKKNLDIFESLLIK